MVINAVFYVIAIPAVLLSAPPPTGSPSPRTGGASPPQACHPVLGHR